MPVLCDVATVLDIKEVLRRAGMRRPAGARPQLISAAVDLLAEVQTRRLLRPSLVYETYAVVEAGPEHVQLQGGATLRGPLLASALSGASDVAAAVVTIGNDVEDEASRCFRDGRPLRGLLLDAIASAATDTMVQSAAKLLTDAAIARGHRSTCPIYPGQPGFPLTEQRTVLGLALAQDIGVCLTDSGVMLPQKSASFVMGLGVDVPQQSVRGCAHCNLNRTCAQSRELGRQPNTRPLSGDAFVQETMY